VAIELDPVLADGAAGSAEDGREYLVDGLARGRVYELAVYKRHGPGGRKGLRPGEAGGGQVHGAGAGSPYDRESGLPRGRGEGSNRDGGV
jgi:hypothetical protein